MIDSFDEAEMSLPDNQDIVKDVGPCLTEFDFESWVSPVTLSSSRRRIAIHLKACAVCRGKLDNWATSHECRNELEQANAGTLASMATEAISAESEHDQCGDITEVSAGKNPQTETVTTPRPPASPPANSRQGWPQLSGYEIVRKIGQGGMGVVFEAVKLSTRARCAIKILPHGANWVDAEKRFEKEARAAAKLQHPNIVRVTDLKKQNKYHYYEMELVDGLAVNDLVAKFSSACAHKLTRSEILKVAGVERMRTEHQKKKSDDPLAYYRLIALWIRDVADALEYAHSQNIWHRDIKPQNIMLSRDGRMMVTDFGLAKVLGTGEESLPGTHRGGSPRYMSPEQVGGNTDDEIDHRIDIHALGATLYEFLTYKPAFVGQTPPEILSQVIAKLPTPPRQVKTCVPSGLEDICLKSMAKRPGDRFATAGDMREALQEWLNSIDQPATGNRREAVKAGGKSRSNVGKVIAVLLLAAVTFIGVNNVIGEKTVLDNEGGGTVPPIKVSHKPSKINPQRPVVTKPLYQQSTVATPPQMRVGRIMFALVEDLNTLDNTVSDSYGGNCQQKLIERFRDRSNWEVVLVPSTLAARPDDLRRMAKQAGADILVSGTIDAWPEDQGFNETLQLQTYKWTLSWNLEIYDLRSGQSSTLLDRFQNEKVKSLQSGNRPPSNFVRGIAGGWVKQIDKSIGTLTFFEK